MGFQNPFSSRRCDHFHSFSFISYLRFYTLTCILINIYLFYFPGDSRRNRMLNDIYLWVRDSPRSNRRSCDTNLLIFSDQFHDDAYFTDMLQQLSKKVYRLLLVTPTQDINEPASPAWPGLLIDEGAYCFRGT